jgi:sugar phosphate isomerase/epimerase
MKIGMITDSLPDADFDTMLGVAARLEMDMLEFGCGNWSSAPHLKLDRLLESADARREFRARLADHGIAISALNCSGNPVHPGEVGRRHDAVTRKTIRLARLLEVDRVVMMSGCPGAPGDAHANWVTTEWPPEVRDILRWQWEVVLIPYWRDLVAFANEQGIERLCLELHGHQNVYSVATLQRLRDAVGETVGANLDPSHLMWMGADPLAAARALGSAIYYVHAKDTRIEPKIAGVNGVIDTTPGSEYGSRAWNYITLGYGHDEAWWRSFVAALGAAGYDGVLSIEHEDPAMSAVEGVEKSVELLRRAIGRGPARARAAA